MKTSKAKIGSRKIIVLMLAFVFMLSIPCIAEAKTTLTYKVVSTRTTKIGVKTGIFGNTAKIENTGKYSVVVDLYKWNAKHNCYVYVAYKKIAAGESATMRCSAGRADYEFRVNTYDRNTTTYTTIKFTF